ncbi:hypothetical protein RRG08_031332 [Elysia crispata]|uniref:Uncharacterized protein n=1 Tax=Elysia crispata TaxID=231223 RepID=A0AAE1CZT8_9GAST|nr:hypothetical protein RRG08_031332 [Elysia crispata]
MAGDFSMAIAYCVELTEPYLARANWLSPQRGKEGKAVSARWGARAGGKHLSNWGVGLVSYHPPPPNPGTCHSPGCCG